MRNMKLTVCLMLNLMVKTIVLYTGWRVVANGKKRVVRVVRGRQGMPGENESHMSVHSCTSV